MAITGTVAVRGTLSWTRGEFSAGSTTNIYESSTAVFANAILVGNVPSSTTSRALSKTLSVGVIQTFYYWVRHMNAAGTLGATAGPVTGVYDGSGI